ncbi:MAG: putative metal-dependent hydrolase [Saprospiraceae bacterium]|nr:putative metal-dependent hydrolase [Saprospiraceae bacterium]
MTQRELEKLRYPIGKLKNKKLHKPLEIATYIKQITSLPTKLEQLVTPLTEAQRSIPYRPEGWTVRQVVHHVADSHANAYIRLKLTLTENTPTIKPYDENAWALLADTQEVDCNFSLLLLTGIHKRMVSIFRNLTADQWQREYYHPDMKKNVNLMELAAMYAWHGEHHYQHIYQLALRSEWLVE